MFTAFLIAIAFIAAIIAASVYIETKKPKHRRRPLRMLMVGTLCIGLVASGAVGCLQGCATSKDPLTGVETTTVDVNTLAIVVQLAESSYERWQAFERQQNQLSEEQEAREAERRLDRIRELKGLLEAARKAGTKNVEVPKVLVTSANPVTPTPEVVEPSGGDGSSEFRTSEKS